LIYIKPSLKIHRTRPSPSIAPPTIPRPARRTGRANCPRHKVRQVAQPDVAVHAPVARARHGERVQEPRVRRSCRRDCITGSHNLPKAQGRDDELSVTTAEGLVPPRLARGVHVPNERLRPRGCLSHVRDQVQKPRSTADVSAGQRPGVGMAGYAASSFLLSFMGTACQIYLSSHTAGL